MYRDSRGKFVKQQQSPLPENLQQSNQLHHQRERVNNERDSLGENSAESLSPVSIGAPAISTDLLNELAEEKVALMAVMSLQLAASMRQLQSRIQQQVQSSTSSNMPATSLFCEHCQIGFPDQILYMAHMDMHKRQPYTKDDLFYQAEKFQPFQCSRCSHICKDRIEFFLHWRNNECNK